MGEGPLPPSFLSHVLNNAEQESWRDLRVTQGTGAPDVPTLTGSHGLLLRKTPLEG